MDPNRKKSLRREIKLLERLNNIHIVKLFESINAPKHIYLVMEYIQGPSLYG